MLVLSVHIDVLEHILSPATIYAEIAIFSHAIEVTIYALNFEKNCRRRQNLSLTLNQIAAANSTSGAIKYKILPLLDHKTKLVINIVSILSYSGYQLLRVGVRRRASFGNIFFKRNFGPI